MKKRILLLAICFMLLFSPAIMAEEIVDGVVVGGEQYNDARYMRRSQNLSDVSSAATAFGNIKQNASESATGVVELATDAETQTGTDTARAITPANLSARTALDSRAGIVELATNAETITGSDSARAVTPAALANRRSYDDVLVKTDSYIITTADFGKTLIMNAAVEKTFSAPSVDETNDGALVTLVKAGAGKVIFDCADSDTVADSGAGDTIYDDVAGETYAMITLMYVHSLTKWIIREAYGTWTTTD